MKLIKTNELLKTDFNISSIFSMRQYWEENSKFIAYANRGRKTSALLYFCGCSARYTLPDGKSLTVEKGSIVYIPQDTMYTIEFFNITPEAISTIIIEFSTCDTTGEPFVFYPHITTIASKNDSIYKNYFHEAVGLYLSPLQPIAMIKSILYKFISEICGESRISHIYSKKFSGIADGILYLENTVTYDKSIEDIAKMCHVSTACFRKLFKQYCGLSPAQYLTSARISHAKKLLHGDMSVQSVAFALGFASSPHFCKFFKTHTGMTPKEYSELI